MVTFLYINVKTAALLALLGAGAAGLALAAEAVGLPGARTAAAVGAAVTLGGERVDGRLAGAGAAITFESSKGAVPLPDIAGITYGAWRGQAPLVAGIIAADGTILRGAVRVEKSGDVAVASARLGELKTPISKVAEVHFECRGAFPKDAGPGILLKNGDFVSSEALEIAATAVRSKSALGNIEVPVERVAAVRLIRRSRGADALPAPEAVLVLDNGDALVGRLAAAAVDAIKFSTAFGEVTVPLAFVREVDFPARMAYVSDLEAAVSTRGFAPEGATYFLADRSPDGALRSSGVVYRKGLFTRAGTAVVVRLPRGADTLVFTPGIADGADPPQGRFAVEAAAREIWSAAIDEGSTPGPVALKVAGMDSVTLFYASKPEGLIGSAGVWGDAFVTVRGAGESR